jgi:hypothetical protein
MERIDHADLVDELVRVLQDAFYNPVRAGVFIVVRP